MDILNVDKNNKNKREIKSYSEELKIVATRFDMTESQALEFIIHEVYKSKCFSQGLVKALELLEAYDETDDIVPDDISPIDKAISFLYQAIGTLESIGRNPPF